MSTPPKNNKFSVTYEIMTEESAKYGDAAERGWIDEDGYRVQDKKADEAITMTFGLAVKQCVGYGAKHRVRSGGIYCGGSICFELTNEGTHEFYSGKTESRHLHFPKNITEASRRRVCKFLGIPQKEQ